MTDYSYIRYEAFDAGAIARITLDRPRARNAQDSLVELLEAVLRANTDDDVRVVSLAAAGLTFSSGRDLGTPELLAE